MPKNILVALSGGVDSAVAAHLLLEQGCSVTAVYMRTWMNEESAPLSADCPWKADLESARAAAAHLGIELRVINMIDVYRKQVVEHLIWGYENGLTPNPDILCNRHVKFGALLEYAQKEGFDFLATGHYCQKEPLSDGTYALLEGADKGKDQSYFLAMLEQHQLAKALFPIGHLQKPAVHPMEYSGR